MTWRISRRLRAPPLCLLAGVAAGEDAFLGLAFGARPIALGSAYSAVAEGATSVWWNPAGLASVARVELTGSQNHLSFTDNAYAFALAVPAGGAGALAMAVGHLSITNAAHLEGTR